jgi:hypothetical protein
MRQLTVALLTIGATNLANAHVLGGDHGLTEALWHQLIGSHHLLFTGGLLAGTVALIIIGRWISKRRS